MTSVLANFAASWPAPVAAASPLAEVVLFYLFAAVVGGSAVAVVVSRNVVRMSVALMAALAGVAGLFFLLGAEFLAAVQLVVYVGGTLILIVFGVMLTSKSPFSRLDPTRGQVALAAVLAAVLLATLVLALPSPEASVPLPAAATPAFLAGHGGSGDGGTAADGLWYDAARQRLVTDRRLTPAGRRALLDRAPAADGAAFARAVDELAVASRGLPAKHATDPNAAYPMAGLGAALLGDYLLPFELASVLLLAVMIGAAYLAKARPKGDAADPGSGGGAAEPRTPGAEVVAATPNSRRAREWS